MLPEIAIQELENARAQAAGSVFGMNAVSWSIELISEGKFGLDAFYEAIGLAAKMRGFANVRQVEEHYIRQSNERRAKYVTERLTSAITGFSDARLGSLLVSRELTAARRSKKKEQLDEGVPLL